MCVYLADMPKLLIIAHAELFPRLLWSVILQARDFWGPIAGCWWARGVPLNCMVAGCCVERPMGYKERTVAPGVSAKVLALVGIGGGMMRVRVEGYWGE